LEVNPGKIKLLLGLGEGWPEFLKFKPPFPKSSQLWELETFNIIKVITLII